MLSFLLGLLLFYFLNDPLQEVLQGCGEADLLCGWCGGFLAGGCSPAYPIHTRQPFANFSLMLFAAEEALPTPLTSGEGLVLW